MTQPPRCWFRFLIKSATHGVQMLSFQPWTTIAKFPVASQPCDSKSLSNVDTCTSAVLVMMKKTSMLEVTEVSFEATYLLLKTVNVIDSSYSFQAAFLPSIEDAKINIKIILIIPTEAFTLETDWQLIDRAFSRWLMSTKAFTPEKVF